MKERGVEVFCRAWEPFVNVCVLVCVTYGRKSISILKKQSPKHKYFMYTLYFSTKSEFKESEMRGEVWQVL